MKVKHLFGSKNIGKDGHYINKEDRILEDDIDTNYNIWQVNNLYVKQNDEYQHIYKERCFRIEEWFTELFMKEWNKDDREKINRFVLKKLNGTSRTGK